MLLQLVRCSVPHPDTLGRLAAGRAATDTIAAMRWHWLGLLLALTACTGPTCTLGCVSELTIALPDGVTTGEACVEGICTSEVVDGALQVPLGRRADGTTGQVSLTLGGSSTVLEGEIPLRRSRAEDRSCAQECVTGEAVVDLAAGRVLPAPGAGAAG